MPGPVGATPVRSLPVPGGLLPLPGLAPVPGGPLAVPVPLLLGLICVQLIIQNMLEIMRVADIIVGIYIL
jgi:hypothetical protein